MSKRLFTPEQIEDLLRNSNVIKCSPKSISYSQGFKIRAVKQHKEGMTPGQIFTVAGFDKNFASSRTANDCLWSWRRKFKLRGEFGLLVDGRGRPSGDKGRGQMAKELSDSDKIKRLEVEVAYLKAENDFLAKLRTAKKR
jgi:transposase-like protein